MSFFVGGRCLGDFILREGFIICYVRCARVVVEICHGVLCEGAELRYEVLFLNLKQFLSEHLQCSLYKYHKVREEIVFGYH